MLNKKSAKALRGFPRQNAAAAQRAPKKKTGCNTSDSVNKKSTVKVRSHGCPKRPSLATCRTVIQSCCAFQIRMGSRQTAASSSASHGPRRRSCARAGGHNTKNTPQQTHWNRLVYLPSDPRPIQSPTQSHCRVVPPGCTARQPAAIAAVQNNTDNGSIVINR